MSRAPLVIKVGGNDLERPGYLPDLGAAVVSLSSEQPVILVHGGGRAVDRQLQALGTAARYADGQRVTDEAVLEVVEMVLSGSINKRVTRALLAAGVDAVGLSGVDRGLLRVEPWSPELGRVGRVAEVRASWLLELCERDVVPVVSPISLGAEGAYNVNADHAAAAVAGAVEAERCCFVTDVPGVLADGALVPRLAATDARGLIREGVIRDGMIPKVEAALAAIAAGAARALITDLQGLRDGSGTEVTP